MTDPMQEYHDREERLKAMNPTERTWLEGFVNGLLFAQAHNDVEGGKQTLETHLPDEWYDHTSSKWVKFEDLERKLADVIHELDAEGGIVSFRFKTVKDPIYDFECRVIEVGSSEGHFGTPEWEDE